MLDFKYFSPAYILEFVPEAISDGYDDTAEKCLYIYGQYKDLSDAIHFVEENILPALLAAKKTHFTSLMPAQIVAWITQLHAILAKTLLAGHNLPAGVYSDSTILRWQKTCEMANELVQAVAADFPIQLVFKKNQLENVGEPFMRILQKVWADDSILMQEELLAKNAEELALLQSKAEIENHKVADFFRKIYKLIDAYHQNKLPKEELMIIAQVFKICLSPTEIPKHMDQFSQEFLSKIKKCEGDVANVAELARWVFTTLTNIHPFFNGNGRLATLMLNATLLVFNQPAILLRNPKTKLDPNSQYNIAIKWIDAKPKLLRELIKDCIKDCKKESKYSPSQVLLERLRMGAMFAKFKEALIATNRPLQELEDLYAQKMLEIHQQAQPAYVPSFNTPAEAPARSASGKLSNGQKMLNKP